MANKTHLKILKLGGVEQWNKWRQKNESMKPDLRVANLGGEKLSGADLRGADLRGAYVGDLRGGAYVGGADLTGADLRGAILNGADLTGADLTGADLRGAYLIGARLFRARLSRADLRRAYLIGVDLSPANLRKSALRGAYQIGADLSPANLSGADLTGADLSPAYVGGADLTGADLRGAYMGGANLRGANLSGADLTGADLRRTGLVETDFTNATITGCRIYGVSAWNVTLVDTVQNNLVISKEGEPIVTVDNLEVGQFIYLLLNNQKLRGVIDAIGRKGVLILGRFYEERKAVLDALREQLRKFDLVPMVFDFDKPSQRDITETVQLLANMSRFVVADVTDAKSIPQELSHIIPFLPSVPVRPIILDVEYEYSMFEHWKQFNSVLDVYRYQDRDQLIANIEPAIIEPILEWERAFDKQKILQEKNELLQARVRELEAQLAKAAE